MNLNLAVIVVLTALSTGLFLAVVGLKQQLAALQTDRDNLIKTAEGALDAAARSDEKMQNIIDIHQDLLKRPIQAILSEQAALTMAREICAYMNGGGSIDIPIPIRKGPNNLQP